MGDAIAPETLQAWITDNRDCTIVDIRTPAEYALGHIPGTINVPLNELPDRITEIDWTPPIVVVCPVGTASQQAVRLLQSYQGIDQETVKNLTGGYKDWDGPIEQPADT